MSDKIEDGGPAFPAQPCGTNGLPVDELAPGMSLRDWFAGQALAGMSLGDTRNSAADIATDAYAQADAMLYARSHVEESGK